MNRLHGKTQPRVLVGVLIGVAIVLAIVAVLMVDVTGRSGSGLSQAYNLDVAALAKFDPNLIAYKEELPPIATGFQRSRALAVDANGLLYVAGDNEVRVLDRKGQVQRIIKPQGQPQCLAVSADGTIYVGLRDHVELFDAAGQHVASWKSLGKRVFLTSIAVTRSDVFLADAGNAVVIRCDTTGNVINRIGAKKTATADSSPSSAFVVPSAYFDLAVAPDGLLRVVNPGLTRIDAYTFDGDLEFSWGHGSPRIEGFCGCCNPVNIAVLPDGSLVTAEKGLIRVKIYDPDGTLKCVVAGPDQLVEGGASRVFENAADAEASGFDVAIDSPQHVLVLDTIQNLVRIFVRTEADK
jgi:hypothetical protein